MTTPTELEEPCNMCMASAGTPCAETCPVLRYSRLVTILELLNDSIDLAIIKGDKVRVAHLRERFVRLATIVLELSKGLS